MKPFQAIQLNAFCNELGWLMFHPFIDFNDYDYQVHIHGMLWPRSIGTIAALRGFFCLLRLKLENAEQPVAYVCSQILMTPSGWFNYRATIGY